ncbi:MAG: hypothetical protein QM831_08815 [Kofleriaceae bacterium]
MPADLPPIYTRVGHTGAEELRFRGSRVFAELLGKTTTTQMLFYAITGRMLDAGETALVDDMMTAMASADPRLWPFKLTRLASSYGTTTYGMAATIAASQGALFGPTRFEAIANVLVDLAKRSPSDDELEAILRGGTVGFGILYGRYDVRYDQMMGALAKRGHAGRHTGLARQAVNVARGRLHTEPHVFVAIAALGLDLGMTPVEIAILGMLPLILDALPNATEGAAQAPAALQWLPARVAQYVGPGPRTSVRAKP